MLSTMISLALATGMAYLVYFFESESSRRGEAPSRALVKIYVILLMMVALTGFAWNAQPFYGFVWFFLPCLTVFLALADRHSDFHLEKKLTKGSFMASALVAFLFVPIVVLPALSTSGSVETDWNELCRQMVDMGEQLDQVKQDVDHYEEILSLSKAQVAAVTAEFEKGKLVDYLIGFVLGIPSGLVVHVLVSFVRSLKSQVND